MKLYALAAIVALTNALHIREDGQTDGQGTDADDWEWEKGPCDDLPDPCADVNPSGACDADMPCMDDTTGECWDTVTDADWDAYDECIVNVDWSVLDDCWTGPEAEALEACWDDAYGGEDGEGDEDWSDDEDAEGETDMGPDPCEEHLPCQTDPTDADCYENADWSAYEDCWCEAEPEGCAEVEEYCTENPEECDFSDETDANKQTE